MIPKLLALAPIFFLLACHDSEHPITKPTAKADMRLVGTWDVMPEKERVEFSIVADKEGELTATLTEYKSTGRDVHHFRFITCEVAGKNYLSALDLARGDRAYQLGRYEIDKEGMHFRSVDAEKLVALVKAKKLAGKAERGGAHLTATSAELVNLLSDPKEASTLFSSQVLLLKKRSKAGKAP